MTDDPNVAYPDATLDNADWTKRTWDLPPYKSAEFFAVFPAAQLPAFRLSPVYRHAVAAGLIRDDEWTAAPTPPNTKEMP
jgi:hypothetical protein